MSGVDGGFGFSKARIEALSDGVFAIAMTLLVIELKLPEVHKPATAAQVLAAMRPEVLGYFGFVLSFMLASMFWIFQHVMFHYIGRVNRVLSVLSLAFLMFVSLLPYSTKLLTGLGLSSQVAQVWYFTNQWLLAVLLAIKWQVARRLGFITGDPQSPDYKSRNVIFTALPVVFLVPIVAGLVVPTQAFLSLLMAVVALRLIASRASRTQAA